MSESATAGIAVRPIPIDLLGGHVMRLPHLVVCVVRVPSERGMCTNDYEFGLNEICGIFMDNGLVC